MFCKNCGAQMTDNAKFCIQCGENATPSPAKQQSETSVKPSTIQVPKKKSKAKKTLVWVLSIVGVLLIFLVVLILLPEPKEELPSKSDFVGVWQVVGLKETLDDDIKLLDTSKSKVFTLIFKNGSLSNLEVLADGTVVDPYETNYIYKNGHLESFINGSEYPDDAHVRISLDKDGYLIYTDWYDNEAQSPYSVCTRMEGEPQDYIVSTESNPAPLLIGYEELEAGLESNIEKIVAGKAWESNGITVDALPNGGMLPDGYPRIFPGVKGGSVYVFDTIAKTLNLTTYDNGLMDEEVTKPYTLDPTGKLIISFNRTQNINGTDYALSSKFFVSNGVLYECEVIDGYDASNYLAHTVISTTPKSSNTGSVQDGIDKIVAGLNRDIMRSIGGKAWGSNGNTVAAMPDPELPNGYPRVFPNPEGAAVYTFDITTMTVTLTNYNDGLYEGEATVPFTLAGDTYIYAFERTQNIDGKSRNMRSVYFISDGILFECEQMDGRDASNYLAHEVVGTATQSNLQSGQAAIDALVAGLDRDIRNTITTQVWESNGSTVECMPNPALPSGYPRTHENKKGAAVYDFNTKTMMATLEYFENGVLIDETTVPFEFAGNTYINAFKRTITIGGVDYEAMSTYFISNGLLYECEVVGGMDASNYLAHSPIS